MRIEAFSPFPVMGWITMAAGAMLWAAAALQGAGMGRAINLGAGLVLVAMGAGLRAMRRRHDAD
jgi:fatty acid desaturase